MHTSVAHIVFEHLGKAHGVAQQRVGRCSRVLELGYALYGIRQVHLLAVRQLVWNSLAERVYDIERHLLHTCHVLYGQLGSHGAVGDDVRHLLRTILVSDPLQHLSASVVVEVGIYIGERYTVGVEETFEEEVVFDRVYLSDAQAVGHSTACRRATSWAYPHAEFLACGVDEVLHYEEVARESHGLHDVQLKVEQRAHIVRHGVAIELLCSVVCYLLQVVGLKLYAV